MIVIPEGKIVKAAIKVGDEIFTGWRHSDIRNIIIKEKSMSQEEMKKIMNPWNQGFVTENGIFLTRTQAYSYGQFMGQVGSIIGSELTSEDLWDNYGNPIPPKTKELPKAERYI